MLLINLWKISYSFVLEFKFRNSCRNIKRNTCYSIKMNNKIRKTRVLRILLFILKTY